MLYSQLLAVLVPEKNGFEGFSSYNGVVYIMVMRSRLPRTIFGFLDPLMLHVQFDIDWPKGFGEEGCLKTMDGADNLLGSDLYSFVTDYLL